MTQDHYIRRVLKPAVWALCLAPLIWLCWLAYAGQMTANPIEFINRYLGDWALRMLLVALAITPLRAMTGWAGFARFRRLIGLFAFFYVALHVINYVAIDNFFDWTDIWKDIVKRTYITVGMVAFVILAALAATSTKGMIKRLGGKNWNRLHKGVYLAAAAGCLHFFMMRKGIQMEPIWYAVILLALLLYRAVVAWRKHARRMKATTMANHEVGVSTL